MIEMVEKSVLKDETSSPGFFRVHLCECLSIYEWCMQMGAVHRLQKMLVRSVKLCDDAARTLRRKPPCEQMEKNVSSKPRPMSTHSTSQDASPGTDEYCYRYLESVLFAIEALLVDHEDACAAFMDPTDWSKVSEHRRVRALAALRGDEHSQAPGDTDANGVREPDADVLFDEIPMEILRRLTKTVVNGFKSKTKSGTSGTPQGTPRHPETKQRGARITSSSSSSSSSQVTDELKHQINLLACLCHANIYRVLSRQQHVHGFHTENVMKESLPKAIAILEHQLANEQLSLSDKLSTHPTSSYGLAMKVAKMEAEAADTSANECHWMLCDYSIPCAPLLLRRILETTTEVQDAACQALGTVAKLSLLLENATTSFALLSMYSESCDEDRVLRSFDAGGGLTTITVDIDDVQPMNIDGEIEGGSVVSVQPTTEDGSGRSATAEKDGAAPPLSPSPSTSSKNSSLNLHARRFLCHTLENTLLCLAAACSRRDYIRQQLVDTHSLVKVRLILSICEAHANREPDIGIADLVDRVAIAAIMVFRNMSRSVRHLRTSFTRYDVTHLTANNTIERNKFMEDNTIDGVRDVVIPLLNLCDREDLLHDDGVDPSLAVAPVLESIDAGDSLRVLALQTIANFMLHFYPKKQAIIDYGIVERMVGTLGGSKSAAIRLCALLVLRNATYMGTYEVKRRVLALLTGHGPSTTSAHLCALLGDNVDMVTNTVSLLLNVLFPNNDADVVGLRAPSSNQRGGELYSREHLLSLCGGIQELVRMVTVVIWRACTNPKDDLSQNSSKMLMSFALKLACNIAVEDEAAKDAVVSSMIIQYTVAYINAVYRIDGDNARVGDGGGAGASGVNRAIKTDGHDEGIDEVRACLAWLVRNVMSIEADSAKDQDERDAILRRRAASLLEGNTTADTTTARSEGGVETQGAGSRGADVTPSNETAGNTTTSNSNTNPNFVCLRTLLENSSDKAAGGSIDIWHPAALALTMLM